MYQSTTRSPAYFGSYSLLKLKFTELPHSRSYPIHGAAPFKMAENVAALAPEYRALQDAFERLQKKISPGGIIGALYSRNLLLLNEADTIRSKVATLEKNEELLFAISRRSPAQVLQFCQFLLGEQCHCGNILKEGNTI